MDILLGIIIFISSPVFYIIGLVTFIKWLARGGGRKPGAEGGSSAAMKVREYASKQPPDVARDLNQLANELEGVSAYASAAPSGPVATARFEPGKPAPAHSPFAPVG